MDKTSLALEMMTAVKDKLNVKKLKKKSLSLSEEIKYPRKKEQLPVKVKVVKMRTLLSLPLLQALEVNPLLLSLLLIRSSTFLLKLNENLLKLDKLLPKLLVMIPFILI